jgi:hypothetical protein
VSTSLSISIASIGTVSPRRMMTEPSSERVTAASLQSLRMRSSATSKDEVW